MRNVTPTLLLALATSITPIAASSQTSVAALETISIRLSNFAFTPDHLRLRVGVPVRLQFMNESSGGHNFTAPAFFAASTFALGATPPPDGKVELTAGTTVDLTLTPRVPGSYLVECTHFLHSLFGMRRTIEVVRPAS